MDDSFMLNIKKLYLILQLFTITLVLILLNNLFYNYPKMFFDNLVVGTLKKAVETVEMSVYPKEGPIDAESSIENLVYQENKLISKIIQQIETYLTCKNSNY